MPSAAEQLAANFSFSNLGKSQELRNRIFFTLGALIVARLGTYIPMPGIDPAALAQQINQTGGGLLDVFNVLAGGAVHAWRSSPWASCRTSRPRSSFS